MIFKQSPNFNSGRRGNEVERVVVHWIGSGTYESTVSWLTSLKSKVSAHYVISGDRITQLVKEEDTAWHAGNLDVNYKSIGIEHDSIPDRPASEETYKTSAKLISEICKRYSIPIDKEHIIRHSQIKPTQCPGTIDIDKLISLAKGNMNFIDLKKRLSDVSWAELKEFTSLERLGLIERADSIQTMTMKWLKSNSDMSINQAKSLELLSKRDETIVNLNKEISDLKTAIDALKTASIDEIKVLIDRADSLQKANDTQSAIIKSFDETNNLFNLIKSWLKK